MKTIPIAKPYLTEDEAKAAYDAVLSGWVTQGPKVIEFEEKFAQYCGAKYAVAVSSCTTALHLSMVVAGIQEGDEVICPSLSYIATSNSVRYVGATPIFAEVAKGTYNIDLSDVEKKITSKTKAILVVHQIGMPVDIDAFTELSKRYNVKLIEDAACAVGSSYKGDKIGSHSELVCFSFHPRKIMTTGDGGMITTSNVDYYKRLKLLRQHGMSMNDRERHESKKVIIEEYVELGYNYRMTDIQGAIGLKQLEKLDQMVTERRKIAQKYIQELSNLKCIILPNEEENFKSNYQSFSVYLKESCPISRNDLMQKMLDLGISTRRGVMTSHREKACTDLNQFDLTISENMADHSILLPLYSPMSIEEVDKVIREFKGLVH